MAFFIMLVTLFVTMQLIVNLALYSLPIIILFLASVNTLFLKIPYNRNKNEPALKSSYAWSNSLKFV